MQPKINEIKQNQALKKIKINKGKPLGARIENRTFSRSDKHIADDVKFLQAPQDRLLTLVQCRRYGFESHIVWELDSSSLYKGRTLERLPPCL